MLMTVSLTEGRVMLPSSSRQREFPFVEMNTKRRVGENYRGPE